jgi:hypothetical protein
MKRFYQREENGFTDHLELNRQTAFHEAGHVAAIYLENKRKSLPPVYFQIHVSKPDNMAQPLFAKVNGGRLVGDLATVIHEDVTHHRDSTDIDNCQLVYEADIISFLAGPIAEAKYVSIRDNEVFNINLLTPQAMNHYGGNADMLEVMSYLEFFIPRQNNEKCNSRPCLPRHSALSSNRVIGKALLPWRTTYLTTHTKTSAANKRLKCWLRVKKNSSRLWRFMKAGGSWLAISVAFQYRLA